MIKNTVLTMGLAGLAFFSIDSRAQTAFPGGTSVVLAKPGSNNAAPNYTLYTTTTPTNATSFVAGPTIAFTANVNGIGLNPTDKLLYGAAFKDPGTPTVLTDDVSLYRIGADGVYANLGLLPVTGQGAAIPVIGGIAEFVNFSAGTIAPDGSYTYMTIALKQSGVTKILNNQLFGTPLNLNSDDIRSFIAKINNVAALSANPGAPIAATPSSYYELTTTDPKIVAGMNGFLQDVNQNFPDVSYSNGGIQDIDIDPVSGQLYAYLNYQDPSPTPGQSVDVVGFPIVASAPVGGVATLSAVGNTINQTPDQEVAGIGFDLTGNLFALFTSGQYGQLNLSTGAIDNIVVSNIPTITYLNQNHLRGDFARAVPQTLPVTFETVEAISIGDQLSVNWTTSSEYNNDHFEIEASSDGKNFTKIGTLSSKAVDGKSTSPLQYSFTSGLGSAIFGLSILGMGLVGFKNRRHKMAGLLAIIGLMVTIHSCSKSDTGIFDSKEDLYIRVAQIDKDGLKAYSKIVKSTKR